MNYAQSTQWLESLEVKMSGFTLETIKSLCILSGINPARFKTVHVAGSNGKGSTCAFVAQILTEEGYKTGLYTSPHLSEYTERIKVNKRDISEKKFAELATYFRGLMEKNTAKASQFEVITAMAFKYFEEEQIEVLVAEVGLGGRLDATNILNGAVCIITSLSLEHTQYLGDTIEQIAHEKSGIIKKESSVIVFENNTGIEAIKRSAKAKNADLKIVRTGRAKSTSSGNFFDLQKPPMHELKTSMIGIYQIENAALAAAACIELSKKGIKISQKSIRKGLEGAKWPCRLEIVSKKPRIVVDSAHNTDGWKKLFESLSLFDYDRLVVVFAAMKDKDVSEFGLLAKKAKCELILTEIEMHRCEKAQVLRKKIGFGKPIKNPFDALQAAKQACAENDMLVITGSIYFIGKIYGKI